jgi:hypothetical protein
MTSTLRGSSRPRTSTQSPRWNCALFPGPVGTILYGFRMTTPYFRRGGTKALEGVWPGRDGDCGHDALVASAAMPNDADEGIRSAAIVWFRR